MRKTSKYKNRKFTVNGISWDSEAEYRRYKILQLMERAGEISNLERQVPFELIPKTDKYRATKYIADFVYTDKDGQRVIEDVKGVMTEEFKLKRKLFYHVYGTDIAIVSAKEYS